MSGKKRRDAKEGENLFSREHLNKVLRGGYLPENKFSILENVMASANIYGEIISLECIDNLQCISENIASIIENIQYRFESRAEVNFCIVKTDKTVFAKSIRVNHGFYIIAISTSLIDKLLNHSHVLSNIKNTEKFFEYEYTEILNLRNNVIYPEDLDQSDPDLCLKYYNLGDALGLAMIGNIIFHELSHILAGHLSFKFILSKDKVCNGVFVANSDEELKQTEQTLEQDADCFSAVKWLQFFDLRPIFFPIQFGPHLKSRESWIKFCAYSAVSTFSWQDIIWKTEKNWPDIPDLHCPPHVRAWAQLLTIERMLEEGWGVSRESAVDMCLDAYLCAFNSAALLSNPLQEIEVLEDLKNRFLKDFDKFTQKFFSRWAAIRDDLREFRLIKGDGAPALVRPG